MTRNRPESVVERREAIKSPMDTTFLWPGSDTFIPSWTGAFVDVSKSTSSQHSYPGTSIAKLDFMVFVALATCGKRWHWFSLPLEMIGFKSLDCSCSSAMALVSQRACR